MKKILKNKGLAAAAAAVVLILIIFIVGVCMKALGGDKIYGGVKAEGISLSGLTVEEAEKTLSEKMPEGDFDKTLNLVLDGRQKSVDVSDFVYGYSAAETAQAAYEVGRSGGFFGNTFSVLLARMGLKNVDLQIDYDSEKLDAAIEELMSDVGERVEEYSYEIKDDSVLINTGKSGFMPDDKKVAEEILQRVSDGEYDREIVFEKEERQPSDIDVNELYEEICGAPENAEYVRKGNSVSVKPHKTGVEFDKAEAEALISENRGAGKEFSIPAEVVKPEVLKEELEGKLFTDTLATYTTRYNAGVIGRSKNVSLSSELINGTVLLPGEEFSYNGVVGERTAERGFATATVYLDGESVDGIGGGICQVSSTLYCAVLYADLEVLERVNHQLTVGYVPLGQDATVDYGNIDFRFRNNTNYPVKILVSAGGGTLNVSLEGYKENKNKKVIIENETVEYIAPVEKIEKDPTMPLGERKIEEEGSSGAVVNTYKSIVIDGETKSRKMITKSTYGAGKTLVREGTGEDLEPTESPLPEGSKPGGETVAETAPGTETPTVTPSASPTEVQPGAATSENGI